MKKTGSGGGYSGGSGYGSFAGGSYSGGGSYSTDREIILRARGDDLVGVINRNNFRTGENGP